MEATNHHNPHNDRCNDAESFDDLCRSCWAGYSEWSAQKDARDAQAQTMYDRWLADGSLDGWMADLQRPL